MSHSDARVERSDSEFQPVVSALLKDEEPPARRLLAHDMEHLVWEDDGERPLPPPD